MSLDLVILEKTFMSGVVGFGFAILFNVPKRLLLSIFLVSTLAGFIKFAGLGNGVGIISISMIAATAVGFASIPISRFKHTSPFVISIPSVIAMIPGYFGYQTLLGIMQLALRKSSADDLANLMHITHNALSMLFILGSLSIGVSLPWLLFREKGVKKIRIGGEDELV